MEHSGIRLITDPWLFGTAFDNGWDLLCKSDFSANDFESITHIWFSHEHPDHFAPPVLFSITEDVRKKITVLFQETKDGRVANFCRKLGFQVIELANREPLQLTEGLVMTCGAVRPIDSWLLVETPTTRILNLNDCIVENKAKALSIKRTVGEVDILLTQFAYAQWVGNPEDISLLENAKQEKLERIQIQAGVFKPTWVCPFASFVRFSHAENEYLNQGVATVREAAQVIKETTEASPLVLYPGDVWVPGEDWDTEASLEKYDSDYESGNWELQPAGDSISVEALQEEASEYLKSARKRGNPIAMKLWRHRLKKGLGRPLELSISLFDSDTKLLFDWDVGLSVLKRETKDTDLSLSSSSLSYILKHEWGFGTVRVNGRYRATVDGKRLFSLIFPFGTLHSIGKAMNLRYIITQYVFLILKKLIGRHSIETEEEPSFLGLWRQTPV